MEIDCLPRFRRNLLTPSSSFDHLCGDSTVKNRNNSPLTHGSITFCQDSYHHRTTVEVFKSTRTDMQQKESSNNIHLLQSTFEIASVPH